MACIEVVWHLLHYVERRVLVCRSIVLQCHTCWEKIDETSRVDLSKPRGAMDRIGRSSAAVFHLRHLGQGRRVLSLLGQSGPRRFLMQGKACRKIVADVAAKRKPRDDLGVAANRRT